MPFFVLSFSAFTFLQSNSVFSQQILRCFSEIFLISLKVNQLGFVAFDFVGEDNELRGAAAGRKREHPFR